MSGSRVQFHGRCIGVTYVGTSRFRFYKDQSKDVGRLQKSLEAYDIELKIYRFADLKEIIPFPNSDFFYLFTRYGAGAWFWKPLIILDALNKYGPTNLIYLDADCAVTSDPRFVIEEELKDQDVALFQQNSKLAGWMSRRSSRLLSFTEADLSNANLVTAGILILKNSEFSKTFMKKWGFAMKDPRILLHPVFFAGKPIHRHDQSVLSSLLYKGDITAKLMKNGFYSKGSESLEENISDAWVYSGELESSSVDLTIKKRIALILDYYSRIGYDILKTLIIFPIHLLFFFVQNQFFGEIP
jgi:hypothetical protein